jgi:hypothetical protein
MSAIAFAVLLAGCTTTYVSPVEVTRFTGDQPQALGSGPIAVRSGPGASPDSLELGLFREAVARELQEQGYVIIDGEAPQVAEVSVGLSVEQPDERGSPVSGGVGVGGGSYGSGAGVGIGIDLSPRASERLHRELRVMIKPAQGGTALWEGRARFSATANSDFAETRAAANRLADALFSGFPGQSGETIEVR